MRHLASSRPAASVFRAWALAALLPWLLCGAGAAPTGRLPEWLLGDWTAVEVRQDDTTPYVKGDDPQRWYSGRTMTVTPDRLTFARDACEVGSVRAKHGPISLPIRSMAGVGLDAFSLPPEPKPVSYLAIQCAPALLDMGDGRGIVHELGIKFA